MLRAARRHLSLSQSYNPHSSPEKEIYCQTTVGMVALWGEYGSPCGWDDMVNSMPHFSFLCVYHLTYPHATCVHTLPKQHRRKDCIAVAKCVFPGSVPGITRFAGARLLPGTLASHCQSVLKVLSWWGNSLTSCVLRTNHIEVVLKGNTRIGSALPCRNCLTRNVTKALLMLLSLFSCKKGPELC